MGFLHSMEPIRLLCKYAVHGKIYRLSNYKIYNNMCGEVICYCADLKRMALNLLLIKRK